MTPGPSIPLASAVLCVNCDCITNSKKACLVCGSHSLLNMAAILNRTLPELDAKQMWRELEALRGSHER